MDLRFSINQLILRARNESIKFTGLRQDKIPSTKANSETPLLIYNHFC